MEKKIKWKNNILIYTIIYFLIFMFAKFILNICDIEFMQSVYIATTIIVIMGGILGTIQIAVETKNKLSKIVIGISIIIVIVTCAIFGRFLILIFAFSFSPEHVVRKDGKKMVAYVNAFLHTNVEYYEYINKIIRGNKIILKEDYGKGGFDPLDEKSDYDHEVQYYTYYDKDGNTEKTNIPQINKTEHNNETTESNTTVLSSKDKQFFQVSDKVSFSVEIVDYAMGKEAIQIYKSIDGNQTSTLTLKTENQALWVHYNSIFNFIDENTGFIYDPGRDGNPDDYGTIQVTQDGGQTFKEATIVHPSNIEEKHLIPSDVPKIDENNQLVLKIYTVNHAKNPVKTYYKFITNDNGHTWEYEDK